MSTGQSSKADALLDNQSDAEKPKIREQKPLNQSTQDLTNAGVVWTSKDYNNLSDKLKSKYPSAIVIGARKAGTSALLIFLCMHPNVSCAKTSDDCFFNFDEDYKKGPEFWLQTMPPVRTKYNVLKCAEYFTNEKAPARIHALKSDVKILLILRNPITRLISDYMFLRRYRKRPQAAEKFHKLQELLLNSDNEIDSGWGCYVRSLYADHLQKWLKWFPMNQIMIVDGEQYATGNPADQLSKVEQFLGLPRYFTSEEFVYNTKKKFYCHKTGCLHGGKGHKQLALDPNIRTKLQEKFSPYNAKLFKLINATFEW
jgi:hypothetical protein